MPRKKFLERVRERYEVIETGGMAPKNPPPPPRAVSKRPNFPKKARKD